MKDGFRPSDGPGRRASIAVDIGGTFTDILVRTPDGTLFPKKVLSTVDDYGQSIIEGISSLLGAIGLPPEVVGQLRHATTIASNTILEKKGAKVGLIGTSGFRDVLEIRNLRMPVLYDLRWEKPEPLVPRRLRITVVERIGADGAILQPLDLEGAEDVIRRLVDEGIEALAVCLINSFINPAHERVLAELAATIAPSLPVSLSSDVLPEIKEYERTSTTVVNAYVGIAVRRYLADLQERLESIGVIAGLRVMQSNGALMTTRHAVDLPVHIIESGPAAGVIGAQDVALQNHMPDVISFDMGGTTAKASLIEKGAVTHAADFQVGGGLISGSRLLTGAGYLVKVPAIDIAEVGAGGGSIIHVDRAGGLKVGPASAGAFPGPVCYGFGGTDVTITDANLILGYVNPVAIADGTVPVDRTASLLRFEEMVAKPLGISVEDAAYGAFLVATSTMIRAIRAVTVERGRDPSRFSLVAFGGNGPIFAHSLAEAMGIERILVPRHAGLFSAVGLLAASSAAFRSSTFSRKLAGADATEIENAWHELEARALADLGDIVETASGITAERRASLRYVGQRADLTIAVPPIERIAETPMILAELFSIEHLKTYGHRAAAGEPVELVNLQVTCQPVDGIKTSNPVRVPHAPLDQRTETQRDVYFGPKFGWRHTPVIARETLGVGREGPLIVEEPDTTCVIPPGQLARHDRNGNILIMRGTLLESRVGVDSRTALSSTDLEEIVSTRKTAVSP